MTLKTLQRGKCRKYRRHFGLNKSYAPPYVNESQNKNRRVGLSRGKALNWIEPVMMRREGEKGAGVVGLGGK